MSKRKIILQGRSYACQQTEWHYLTVMLVLFLVPYLVVGYDILRKAFKGIRNKQVFDEKSYENYKKKISNSGIQIKIFVLEILI